MWSPASRQAKADRLCSACRFSTRRRTPSNALGEIDISVLFVPAAGVKDAAISAIDAGIKLTVLVPDRVPVWDAMEIAAAAKANDARFSARTRLEFSVRAKLSSA